MKTTTNKLDTPIKLVKLEDVDKILELTEERMQFPKKYDIEKINCAQHYLRKVLALPQYSNDSQWWISVSERLPEEDADVIIFIQDENSIKHKTQRVAHFNKYHKCFDLNPPQNWVTHWMQLPKTSYPITTYPYEYSNMWHNPRMD